MHRLLVVIGFIGFAITANSCKPSDPQPVSPENTSPVSGSAAVSTWQLNPELSLYDKVLLSVQATRERMVVAGLGGFFQMDAGDTSFVSSDPTWGLVLNRFGTAGGAGFIGESATPPIIGDDLFANVSSDGKMVGLSVVGNSKARTSYYKESASALYFSQLLPNSDFSAASLGIDASNNLPFGAYNKQKRSLLLRSKIAGGGTIIVNRQDTSSNFAGYYSSLAFPERLLKAYKAVHIPNLDTYASMAAGDHFVVAGYNTKDLYNQLYAVYADGTVRAASAPGVRPTVFFSYRGHLYGSDNFGSICRSVDEGLTWQKVIEYNFSSQPNFAEVDGKLVAYGQSQLFLLDDGTETFKQYDAATRQLVELANTGLVGNKLTGLAQFGDRVYATTLSGLYQIKLKDFFTLKKAVN
jgi:hypothetical protein